MTPIEREPFLTALDVALLPLGFKRSRSGFEWRHREDEANTQWIHLNFGLHCINPSFGIRFNDLEKLLPTEAGSVIQVSRMLASITGVSYSKASFPASLASDIMKFALPELERLQDRESVAALLSSSTPAQWPVSSRSHRIRLLPLILVSRGKSDEAFQWLSEFESSEGDLDQLLPNFQVFSNHFKSRFSA